MDYLLDMVLQIYKILVSLSIFYFSRIGKERMSAERRHKAFMESPAERVIAFKELGLCEAKTNVFPYSTDFAESATGPFERVSKNKDLLQKIMTYNYNLGKNRIGCEPPPRGHTRFLFGATLARKCRHPGGYVC